MALIYKQVVTAVGRVVPRKMQPFWNHPAGRLSCQGRLELETYGILRILAVPVAVPLAVTSGSATGDWGNDWGALVLS